MSNGVAQKGATSLSGLPPSITPRALAYVDLLWDLTEERMDELLEGWNTASSHRTCRWQPPGQQNLPQLLKNR